MVNNRVSKRVADPGPVFLHGSGSGFQISLDPVSAQILEQKKMQEGLSEENLKEAGRS